MDKAYKSEKNSSASLQRELAGFQAQQREALEARHEAEKLRQRLENLTAVQSVVQGEQSKYLMLKRVEHRTYDHTFNVGMYVFRFLPEVFFVINLGV